MKTFLGKNAPKNSPKSNISSKFKRKLKPKVITKRSPQRKSKSNPKLKLQSRGNIYIGGIDVFGTKKMPKELIWKTMFYLPVNSIKSWCSTNKYFKEEICTDEFWRLYLKNKYKITVKLYQETWMEAIYRYSKSYDLISMKSNERKITREVKKVVGAPDSKYYKVLFVNRVPLTMYFINDNFDLYYYYKGVTTLIKKNIIDVSYTFKIKMIGETNIDFHHLILVTGSGSLNYIKLEPKSLNYIKFGSDSNLDFKEIKIASKAVFVNEYYILTQNGQTIKYNITNLNTSLENDINFETFDTPVPFKWISDFGNRPHYGGNSKNHEWTAALDFNGSVLVKGDNYSYQMGVEKKEIYGDFVKLKLKNIIKIDTHRQTTLFLDVNNQVWTCGTYGRTKILKPIKLNIEATDIFSVYVMNKEGIYRIEKPDRIVKIYNLKGLNLDLKFGYNIKRWSGDDYDIYFYVDSVL